MMLLIRFTFERFDCTVAPKRYCRQEMFHHAIPIVVGTTDSRETCNIAPGVRPASARRLWRFLRCKRTLVVDLVSSVYIA